MLQVWQLLHWQHLKLSKLITVTSWGAGRPWSPATIRAYASPLTCQSSGGFRNLLTFVCKWALYFLFKWGWYSRLNIVRRNISHRSAATIEKKEQSTTLIIYIITKIGAKRGTSDTNIDLARIPLEEGGEKCRFVAFCNYEDGSLWQSPI